MVDKLDLRKYMNFNAEVTHAQFDEHKGIWNLKIRQKQADGTVKESSDDCDLLLGAIGILDRWNLPAIPGIEKFKGKIIHTAGYAYKLPKRETPQLTDLDH